MRHPAPRLLVLLPLATTLLLGCPPAEDSPQDTEPTDTGEIAPFEDLFTFVILADPHITSEGDHADRARAAVAWVNEHAQAEGIELLAMVGDIAWNDGPALAMEIFGDIAVPWVPVTGDNEIQSDDEQAFYEAFAPQWQALAGQLDGFSYPAMPVDNPDWGWPSWFTNMGFQHRGVTFLGLDWCSRSHQSLFGEMADLHDFEGGTMPWLQATLEGFAPSARDSVVMFSHHPMHLSPGSFDLEEMAALEAALEPWRPQLYADFAGHYHDDGEGGPESGLWEVYVSDATWDDENRLLLVRVQGNGARFAYTLEPIAVD